MDDVITGEWRYPYSLMYDSFLFRLSALFFRLSLKILYLLLFLINNFEYKTRTE